MSPTMVEHEVDSWRKRLYLPAYRVGEAARFIRDAEAAGQLPDPVT